MGWRLGVDVGGTFTDLVLVEDGGAGRMFRAKVPSTPEDQSAGVLAGIAKVCAAAAIAPGDVDAIMHGTTVATNAVLEGKGARVGLVTTRGFRQVLQIARSHIPGGLGAWVVHPKPVPLAPLELTIEVPERIATDGHVLEALDEDALRAGLRRLAARGPEAMTVSFINAFANAAHERRAREIIAEEMPGVTVSISSEVLPEMLEYERTLTTVANSYVAPVVSRYITRLQEELGRRAIAAPLHILRSDGGLASAGAAVRTPVSLLMSGPAGGVAGALWIARQSGHRNLLTLDMGGTSTDVALIEDVVPRLKRETVVGDVTVRASSLDVRTVGAGGGSIAHVPRLTGALRVGPESAGAKPGPACYGRGGTLPTVTDANLVLGYLPAALLGGEMTLDRAAAEAAIAPVAEALGLGLREAAAGIVAIVNEAMYGALRLVSVQQGYDPRDFALVAFGGAGPLHANALARLLGAWPVIVPPSPGLLCAYGDATTSLRHEASRTLIRRVAEIPAEDLADLLDDLGAQASAALAREGVPAAAQSLRFEVDCRYHGQGLQIPIAVEPEALRRAGTAAVAERFHAAHRRLFTFALDEPAETVNLRAVASAPPAVAEPPRLSRATGPALAAATIGRTRIWVDGEERDAPILDRAALRAGHGFDGPAIVTELDSTTLILPGHRAEVDEVGNILIRPSG